MPRKNQLSELATISVATLQAQIVNHPELGKKALETFSMVIVAVTLLYLAGLVVYDKGFHNGQEADKATSAAIAEAASVRNAIFGEPVVTDAAFSASPTPEIAPICTFERYEVQEGDTLEKIAARYGLSPSVLGDLNQLVDLNLIKPGWILLVPNMTFGTSPADPVVCDLI